MVKKVDRIRPGDKVEILEDKWIRRVGYALHYKEVMQVFLEEPELLKRAAEPFQQLGMPLVLGSPATRELAQGLAKAYVLANNYGGPQRFIHYREVLPKWSLRHIGNIHAKDFHEQPAVPAVGKVLEVWSTYVRHTGKRVGTVRGYDSYSGEYWEEKGYLEDRKTHVILVTSLGDIEVCHVKLVEKGKGRHDQIIPR